MSDSLTCSVCKLTKPATGFVKYKTGFRKHCKDCHNKKAKTYRTKNPDSVKNSKLKQTLGVTLADKIAIVKKQNGCCAVCKIDLKTVKLTSVDHCHKTGKIRGVLCNACNVGLGHFRDSVKNLFFAAAYLVIGHFKDSIQNLKSAIQYLIKHQS